MRRRHRSLWILVGLVLVLAAGAVAEQVRERKLAAPPLTAQTEREVHAIVRECEGCTRLRLEKVQGSWSLVEPFAVPAHAERVEALIAIGTAPMRHRYATADLDPAKIGLDRPYARLTLGPRLLEFGTTDAINQDRYVRVGDTVALIPDRFGALLRAPPETFVDPRPFAPLPEIRSAENMGQPMDATQLAALPTVTAYRIEPAPKTMAAHRIRVDVGAPRPVEFVFQVDGEDWWLLRRGLPVAYVLAPAEAAKLGLGGE